MADDDNLMAKEGGGEGHESFSAEHESLEVQTFASSLEEEEATEVKGTATVKKVAKSVAENAVRGAILGAPGFVFGIGGAVAKQVNKKIHTASVERGGGAIIHVTAMYVSGLKNRTVAGPFKERELSLTPIIRAKVAKKGFKGGGKNALKISPGIAIDTKTMGPDGRLVFKKKNTSELLLPMGVDHSLEAMKGACLLIEIEDTPIAFGGVAALAKKAGAANFIVGTALLSLKELLDSLDGAKLKQGISETVELPAKLSLSPCGEVGLLVSITTLGE